MTKKANKATKKISKQDNKQAQNKNTEIGLYYFLGGCVFGLFCVLYAFINRRSALTIMAGLIGTIIATIAWFVFHNTLLLIPFYHRLFL